MMKLGDALLQPAAASRPGQRLPAVPADMRVGNMLRLLMHLRQAEHLSRSELARLTHLGVPTVHRLIQDLVAMDLIAEMPIRQEAQKGRPAVTYQVLDRGVLLAGIDYGNEVTRFALASASGRILASSARRSSSLRRQPVEGIAVEIERLVAGLGAWMGNLVGIGLGVAAVVDPLTGVLRNPPKHMNLQSLPLGQLLEARLGCGIIARQDDHFAAIAEASSAGTFPGANPLLVLEIGTGIGAALMVGGVSVMGVHGKFGRIAGWPVNTARRGVAKSTLGVSLVAGGLVDDYHRREGRGQVYDGLSLFAAAAQGDPVADSVLAWAGREIAELVIRLHLMCDPAGIVLGGGLSGGFAVLEPHLRPHLPAEIRLAPSVLGEHAVTIGAILSAMPLAEAFVARRLEAFDSEGRGARGPVLMEVEA